MKDNHGGLQGDTQDKGDGECRKKVCPVEQDNGYAQNRLEPLEHGNCSVFPKFADETYEIRNDAPAGGRKDYALSL